MIIAVAQPASAQTVKITATGTITGIYDAGLFNSSVQIGTPFTYSYLFNYSVPDTLPDDPTVGSYNGYGANGATLTFGDYQFMPNMSSGLGRATINVHDNVTSSPDEIDLFGVNETATGFSSPHSDAQVNAFGQFTNNSILSSDALPPLSIYNLANFHNTGLDGFFVDASLYGDFGQSEVRGTATSLSAELVNPVPEASTTVSLGVMLGLGGLALAVRARRRSRA